MKFKFTQRSTGFEKVSLPLIKINYLYADDVFVPYRARSLAIDKDGSLFAYESDKLRISNNFIEWVQDTDMPHHGIFYLGNLPVSKEFDWRESYRVIDFGQDQIPYEVFDLYLADPSLDKAYIKAVTEITPTVTSRTFMLPNGYTFSVASRHVMESNGIIGIDMVSSPGIPDDSWEVIKNFVHIKKGF